MVPKKAQIWIRYRKCRDKATDTQSQGDPKIVKRGPKGDPILSKKGTKRGPFWRKRGPKIRIFQNWSQWANILRNQIENFQRWSIFTCRTTFWAKGHFYLPPIFPKCPVFSSPVLALVLSKVKMLTRIISTAANNWKERETSPGTVLLHIWYDEALSDNSTDS